MNILIFDHLSNAHFLQQKFEWARDFFYHPHALSQNDSVVQRHIDQCMSSVGLKSTDYPTSISVRLIDKEALAAIPAQNLSYKDGLAILDFKNRQSTFYQQNSFFGLTREFVFKLDCHRTEDKERLVQIEALMRDRIVTFEGGDTASQNHSKTPNTFDTLLTNKLKYCFNPIEETIQMPGLSLRLNTDKTKWQFFEHFALDNDDGFIKKAISHLVQNDFLFTPEQEAPWHSPYVDSGVFDELYAAREKKRLMMEIKNPVGLYPKNYKI